MFAGRKIKNAKKNTNVALRLPCWRWGNCKCYIEATLWRSGFTTCQSSLSKCDREETVDWRPRGNALKWKPKGQAIELDAALAYASIEKWTCPFLMWCPTGAQYEQSSKGPQIVFKQHPFPRWQIVDIRGFRSHDLCSVAVDAPHFNSTPWTLHDLFLLAASDPHFIPARIDIIQHSVWALSSLRLPTEAELESPGGKIASVRVAGKTDDVADADFPWVRPPNSGSSTNVPQHPGTGWLRPNGAAYSKSPVLLWQQTSFLKWFQMMFRLALPRRREVGNILTSLSFFLFNCRVAAKPIRRPRAVITANCFCACFSLCGAGNSIVLFLPCLSFSDADCSFPAASGRFLACGYRLEVQSTESVLAPPGRHQDLSLAFGCRCLWVRKCSSEWCSWSLMKNVSAATGKVPTKKQSPVGNWNQIHTLCCWIARKTSLKSMFNSIQIYWCTKQMKTNMYFCPAVCALATGRHHIYLTGDLERLKWHTYFTFNVKPVTVSRLPNWIDAKTLYASLFILKASASIPPLPHYQSHVCGRVPLIVKRLTDVISSPCSRRDANIHSMGHFAENKTRETFGEQKWSGCWHANICRLYIKLFVLFFYFTNGPTASFSAYRALTYSVTTPLQQLPGRSN